MKKKDIWNDNSVNVGFTPPAKTVEWRLCELKNRVEFIQKNLAENYLKKADLWRGIAIGLVCVAIGFVL